MRDESCSTGLVRWLMAWLPALLLVAASAALLSLVSAAAQAGDASAQQDDFDFFSDEPIDEAELIELPPEPSAWITIGGPIALFGFFAFLCWLFQFMVPYEVGSAELNLRHYTTGVRRGLAMAVVLFGIAFCFGASEIWYQLQLHGTTEAYFAQMSLGKLIAFTHAHLFGFTTSFLIIGIPFSMQFNHLWQYQWLFPLGLAASATDVISWWGIKYLSPNFDWVTMFCGVVFSLSYLYMLIGLLRVLLFPDAIWFSDKDSDRDAAAR